MMEELRALIIRHCETLKREMADVEGCMDRLVNDDEAHASALHQGIEMTHKIKGSSGSIGFANISSTAAALEKCLYAVQDNDDQAQLFEACQHFDTLKELVARVKPEESALYSVESVG